MFKDSENTIDVQLQGMLDMYADGAPVDEIAARFHLSAGSIRAKLHTFPEDFNEAALLREKTRAARCRRPESLAISEMTKRVEEKPEHLSVKELCSIAKVCGDKAQLAEGKATSRVIVEDDRMISTEEAKDVLENLEDVESAIDINTG